MTPQPPATYHPSTMLRDTTRPDLRYLAVAVVMVGGKQGSVGR
jgi:hypothetical protein